MSDCDDYLFPDYESAENKCEGIIEKEDVNDKIAGQIPVRCDARPLSKISFAVSRAIQMQIFLAYHDVIYERLQHLIILQKTSQLMHFIIRDAKTISSGRCFNEIKFLDDDDTTLGAGVKLWTFCRTTCDFHRTVYSGAVLVIAWILITIVFTFQGSVNCLCLSRGQNWCSKGPACNFSSSTGEYSCRLMFHAVQLRLWFEIICKWKSFSLSNFRANERTFNLTSIISCLSMLESRIHKHCWW